MGRKINIEGNTFGLLTAVNREFKDKYSRWHWMCKCHCGNEKIISQNNLRSGNSYSCGCEKNIKRVIVDLTGKKFDRLTVIDRDFSKNKTFWNCVCDCGNICSVFHGHLQTGHTRSCGCLLSEISSFLAKKYLCGKKKENHPRWDINKTDVERQKQRPNMKEWSSFIIKRDNYTCFVCNKRGCKLHAHHLDAYSLHVKERNNTENGVCLCKECHVTFHKEYGSKVKREHFHEFAGLPEWDRKNQYEKLSVSDFENLTYNIEQSIKYILRAGKKDCKSKDLHKALWYINRELLNDLHEEDLS